MLCTKTKQNTVDNDIKWAKVIMYANKLVIKKVWKQSKMKYLKMDIKVYYRTKVNTE